MAVVFFGTVRAAELCACLRPSLSASRFSLAAGVQKQAQRAQRGGHGGGRVRAAGRAVCAAHRGADDAAECVSSASALHAFAARLTRDTATATFDADYGSVTPEPDKETVLNHGLWVAVDLIQDKLRGHALFHRSSTAASSPALTSCVSLRLVWRQEERQRGHAPRAGAHGRRRARAAGPRRRQRRPRGGREGAPHANRGRGRGGGAPLAVVQHGALLCGTCFVAIAPLLFTSFLMSHANPPNGSASTRRQCPRRRSHPATGPPPLRRLSMWPRWWSAWPAKPRRSGG